MALTEPGDSVTNFAQLVKPLYSRREAWVIAVLIVFFLPEIPLHGLTRNT